MVSMFKGGWAYFISSMNVGEPTQKFFKNENGESWVITEHWYEKYHERIHEINLEKLHYMKTDYYADLEIFPLYFKSVYNICKSTKRLSSEIEFGINENEYVSTFKIDVGLASKKWRKIGIKIKLTPIIPLSEKPSYPDKTVKTEEPTFEEETPSKRKKSRKIKRSKGFHIQGLKGLSDNISSLVDDETSADVVLKCGMRKIYAHRNILCARSSHFSELFLPNSEEHLSDGLRTDSSSKSDTDVQKTQNGANIDTSITYMNKNNDIISVFKPMPDPDGKFEVDLKGVDSSVFRDFLDYIYSSRLKMFDFDKVKKLFLAAYNYGVKDLEEKCLKDLESVELDITIIQGIHELWKTCKCEKLANMIFYYIKLHPDFAKVHPELNEFYETEREKYLG